MPSRAHENLGVRMRDIEQLLQAHTALTQFQRARRAAEEAGGELAKVSIVIDRLVSQPGRGRRTEVEAVNRAAIVLLCAHLQGYVREVHSEAAQALLQCKVKDLDVLVERAGSRFGNPHADQIDSLFASIGLPQVMEGLSWQSCSNRSVRTRLSDYIQLRNAIAHGRQLPVHKAKVTSFKRFVEVLASNFDDKLGEEIRAITGTRPW